MKELLQTAVDFVSRAKETRGVLAIALFGSVARGEEKKTSDVDLVILHNRADKFNLIKEITKFKEEKVQLTFIHQKELAKETELMGVLSGEGLILYGRPVIIQAKGLDLKSKLLLTYDGSSLKQTEKVKLHRALFGAVSTSRRGSKTYTTKTRGIVKELGVEKLGRGCLLLERSKASRVIGSLKRFGARYRELPIWTY